MVDWNTDRGNTPNYAYIGEWNVRFRQYNLIRSSTELLNVRLTMTDVRMFYLKLASMLDHTNRDSLVATIVNPATQKHISTHDSMPGRHIDWRDMTSGNMRAFAYIMALD